MQIAKASLGRTPHRGDRPCRRRRRNVAQYRTVGGTLEYRRGGDAADGASIYCALAIVSTTTTINPQVLRNRCGVVRQNQDGGGNGVTGGHSGGVCFSQSSRSRNIVAMAARGFDFGWPYSSRESAGTTVNV